MNLEEYYKNLLIVQYHEKSKAQEEIGLGASTFTGDWLMGDIPDIVDVDTAEGAQLDLIGKIVGVSRVAQGFVYGIDFYSYDDEADQMLHPEHKGMSDIGNPVPAIFKDYEDVRTSIYTMSDNLYRKMIKLKILKNNSRATGQEIDDGLYNIFGGAITITDNYDMTGTVVVQESADEAGRLAYFLDLFPRPIGVSYDIDFV